MNERLYFTNQQKLSWYCLKTFRLERFKDDSDCFTMNSCIQLSDGRVLVSGSLEFRKDHQTHIMSIFDKSRFYVIKEPSLGMIDLKMISINSDVYYISGNRCEKFCLVTNELTQMENLNHNHIQAGICKFQDSILVVSGLNCQAIEMYNIERNYWVEISKLMMALFDFNCVEIGENEILCVNKQRTYRISVSNGECVCTRNNKMDINAGLVLKGNYVYCLTKNLELARYSLIDDKWSTLNRTGCCMIQ